MIPSSSPCKGFQIPESRQFFLVEPGIRENFACGTRNPGLLNPEYSTIPLRLETRIHGVKTKPKTVLDFWTWDDSTS